MVTANVKAEYYGDIVKEMLYVLKIHFLHSNLDFVSHQSAFCQDLWNPNMGQTVKH